MPAVPPNFIIAVFSQPIASFAKWKARGINTLVSHEPEGGRVKKSDWEAAAAAAGLFFLDYPADDDATLLAEAKQTHRLAFMQDDEPDLSRQPNTDRTTADGWTRPEFLAARYARCKAAASNLPVFCNFAGPTVTSDAYKGEKHLAYLAAADWLGHDWYVKNKNWQRYPIDHIGKAMDRLAAWSSTGPTNAPPVMTAGVGKPQLVFIECSDQKISPLGRAPTPDEMEAEVQLAVTRGAGVVYFPQRPPPGFQFDATTPELADRMAQINARLAAGNPPAPPAQNEPTLESVVNQMQTLTARLDGYARELESLKNRKYRVAADLQVVDP